MGANGGHRADAQERERRSEERERGRGAARGPPGRRAHMEARHQARRAAPMAAGQPGRAAAGSHRIQGSDARWPPGPAVRWRRCGAGYFVPSAVPETRSPSASPCNAGH